LGKKYPNYNQPKTVSTQTPVKTDTTPAVTADVKVSESKVATVSTQIEQKLLPFESEKVSFQITNHGMGLKNFTINQYQDKEKIRLS